VDAFGETYLRMRKFIAVPKKENMAVALYPHRYGNLLGQNFSLIRINVSIPFLPTSYNFVFDKAAKLGPGVHSYTEPALTQGLFTCSSRLWFLDVVVSVPWFDCPGGRYA